MKERLGIQLCYSMIYIIIARALFLFYGIEILFDSKEAFLVILGFSICMTLFIEAFHYFIIDMYTWFKVIFACLIIISVGILYFEFSYLYLTIILYIDFVVIRDMKRSYDIEKSLNEFKNMNSLKF